MLWPDIGPYVGPTPNRSAGGMVEHRGVVLHIASGFYDGTISWQRNPSADVSSHFIVGRDGRCVQMVDTADEAWAQRAGNPRWLSIELEGFAPDDGLHATHPGWETATPQQIEVCARILVRAHQVYGVPLQLATSPSGRGLGHHSMGAESGVDWGHSQCPGQAIKGQKPAILARAQALASGAITAAADPTPTGDDMLFLSISDDGHYYLCNGAQSFPVSLQDIAILRGLRDHGFVQIASNPEHPANGSTLEFPVGGWSPAYGAVVGQPAAVDVVALAAALVPLLPAGTTVDPAALAAALGPLLPRHVTLTGDLT